MHRDCVRAGATNLTCCPPLLVKKGIAGVGWGVSRVLIGRSKRRCNRNKEALALQNKECQSPELMLVSESSGGEWKSAALQGFKTKPAERLKSAESTSLHLHRDRLALKFLRVRRGWFTVNPGGSAVPQAFPARADLAAQSELPPLVLHQRPVPAQVLG